MAPRPGKTLGRPVGYGTGSSVMLFIPLDWYGGPIALVSFDAVDPASATVKIAIDVDGGNETDPVVMMSAYPGAANVAFVEVPIGVGHRRLRYATDVTPNLPAPVEGVVVAPSVNDQIFPAIGARFSQNQTNFLAWVERTDTGSETVWGQYIWSAGLPVFTPAQLWTIAAPYSNVAMQMAMEPVGANESTARVVEREYLSSGGYALNIIGLRDSTSDGGLLSTESLPPGAFISAPSLGFLVSSRQEFIAWAGQDDEFGSEHLTARLLGPNLSWDGGRVELALATTSQTEPSMAPSDAGAWVAWSEFEGQDGGYDVWLRRLGQDGGWLDAAPVPLAVGPGDQTSPQLAAGASGLLALWRSSPRADGGPGQELWARAFTAPGQPTGPAALVADSTDDKLTPTLAAMGAGYVAAWVEHNPRAFNGAQQLRASRLDATGAPLDPRSGLSPFPDVSSGLGVFQAVPRLAPADGGAWLVAQVLAGAYVDAPNGVMGTLFTGPDAGPIFVLEPTDAGVPNVLARGDGFQAAWVRAGGTLVLASFSGSGAAQGAPQVLDLEADERSAPQLVADGTSVVATWTHRPADGGAPSVRGQWVLADGGLLAPFETPLAGFGRARPATALQAKGTVAVAAEKWEPEVYGAVRLWAFEASMLAQGAGCASSGDCATGFCVQGVCCDRACTDGCETCAGDGGTTAAGTCGPRTKDTLCRDSAPGEGCDAPERCDGVATQCPPDLQAEPGAICRDAAGPCDVAELCNGVSRLCPANRVLDAGVKCGGGDCSTAATCDGVTPACPAAPLPSSTVCRPSAGPCDREEHCDGLSLTCPADAYFGSDTVCRPPATASCDVAETCSGTNATCPADVLQVDETPCGAQGSVCRAGACVNVTQHSRYGFSCAAVDGAGGGLALWAVAFFAARRRRG